jgi:hypothetical protein
MSDFLNSANILGILDFGVGMVASILAILWGYQTRSDFDRDDALELAKIFMGGAAVLFVVSLFYVYAAKH